MIYLLTRRPSVGPLRLDAWVREGHSFTATIPKHPIESIAGGAKASDHIRLDAPVLSLEGIVSKTPLDPLLIAENFAGRWDTALNTLLTLRALLEPFSIITSLGEYKSMFFSSFEPYKPANERGALRFTATAEKVVRLGAGGVPDMDGPDADALGGVFDLGDQFGAPQP